MLTMGLAEREQVRVLDLACSCRCTPTDFGSPSIQVGAMRRRSRRPAPSRNRNSRGGGTSWAQGGSGLGVDSVGEPGEEDACLREVRSADCGMRAPQLWCGPLLCGERLQVVLRWLGGRGRLRQGCSPTAAVASSKAVAIRMCSPPRSSDQDSLSACSKRTRSRRNAAGMIVFSTGARSRLDHPSCQATGSRTTTGVWRSVSAWNAA